MRKAIGKTPDGLDILEPPRTSKRGRTPYLNAAICRDGEGRVKLQRQDFMNALKVIVQSPFRGYLFKRESHTELISFDGAAKS